MMVKIIRSVNACINEKRERAVGRGDIEAVVCGLQSLFT